MWYQLKNFIQSFKTYAVLSPDLKARRQVLHLLRNRPLLSSTEWYEIYGHSFQISPAVTEFAYRYLADYSGLEFGRVLPGDRLDEDLNWTKICWFDWQIALCDDFCEIFSVDLSDELCDIPETTVLALLRFLEERLPPEKS
ncbi:MULTISPECIES: hypothetical protein [unclassified Leptolyngbya]|uniref:hypothetical protein n=1 Tax=unclassified Leptolyngbya TaxID=2650499 RepID=UPI00168615E0|nr:MULTISPECIES: hypothetical protein [unclassified Leptolyngbya]MBD1912270.1 hypothetical protein [Leptolyngbya sp. FACHB-8]MBD2153839.1 hypothetical protein [Leptolyngbya sp. FACHB-16]